PWRERGGIKIGGAFRGGEGWVVFPRRSRLVSWFVGGLNFQVEHHLFPQICHVHYSKLARLVENVCRKFEVRYRVHDTLWGGIASHFRWLRRMGMPEAV